MIAFGLFSSYLQSQSSPEMFYLYSFDCPKMAKKSALPFPFFSLSLMSDNQNVKWTRLRRKVKKVRLISIFKGQKKGIYF